MRGEDRKCAKLEEKSFVRIEEEQFGATGELGRLSSVILDIHTLLFSRDLFILVEVILPNILFIIQYIVWFSCDDNCSIILQGSREE